MKLILRKNNYQEFIDMLTNGELLIQKREIFAGTLYPKKVLRYPFFIDGIEHEVKTSQTKDKILLYARRNNLIAPSS